MWFLYLGRHPVRGAHKAVGRTGHAGAAKVGQLDVPHVRHQDVASLDVPEYSQMFPCQLFKFYQTWKKCQSST